MVRGVTLLIAGLCCCGFPTVVALTGTFPYNGVSLRARGSLLCPDSLHSRVSTRGPSTRSQETPNPFYRISSNFHHSHKRVTTTTLEMSAQAAAAAIASEATRGVGTHFLVRILFLRALALVYGVAFLVGLRQNKALVGDKGITPARVILDEASAKGKKTRQQREEWLEQQKDFRNPTSVNTGGPLGILWRTRFVQEFWCRLHELEWFAKVREVVWDQSDRLGRPLLTLLYLAPDRQKLNGWLDGISLTGLGLAATMLWRGAANVPLLLGLYLCQRSLMAVGGTWYGYGWEPQLAECGFHAMFLVPLWSLNSFDMAVPHVVIWALRWYLFRIMMGAGLIKLKSGDPKWKLRNLSAMLCFYETQPVPNPFTRTFHSAPKLWHKLEVLSNHFVELVAPWLLILPGIGRSWRIVGGLIQLSFQCILISSGNLSFLNWLTMVPAVFCLDDAFLSKLFVPLQTTSASVAAYTQLTAGGSSTSLIRSMVNIVFGSLIFSLSIPVVKNLLSKRQVMNASFDPLRLVNTYGAFGVVNEERIELIVESAADVSGPWKEYDFPVKPGNVLRRPRWISPYHYRLDWQMWIASASGSIDRNPWMYSLLQKLLEQDEGVCKDLLLSNGDPWANSMDQDGKPIKPKYIRVEKWRYRFNQNTGPGEPYWIRERIGRFYPRQGVATIESLSTEI